MALRGLAAISCLQGVKMHTYIICLLFCVMAIDFRLSLFSTLYDIMLLVEVFDPINMID